MNLSYGYAMNYRSGTIGRLRVNDVPVLRTHGGFDGGTVVSGALDALLVPGDNVVSIEIEAAPDEAECIDVRVLEEDRDAPLALFAWPEMAERLPLPRLRPPFVHDLSFRLADWPHQPAYRRARPMDFDCRGTEEQRALVRRFHMSLAGRDVGGFLALLRFRTEADHVASGRDPEYAPEVIEREYLPFFDREIHVRPLDLDLLHFAPCAGGRVCHVQRLDGGPAIQAVALSAWAIEHPEARFDPALEPPSDEQRNMALASDLSLVNVDGEWKIFR